MLLGRVSVLCLPVRASVHHATCTAGRIPVLVGKALPYITPCLMLQVRALTRCTKMLLFLFCCRDTAGQERYASLANLYYRGANAACIVFDITNPESFKKAQHWANELQRNTSTSIVVMLVGNKKDLVSARAVQREEAQEYADRMGMLFIEASAKSAEGVKDIFESLATKVLESQQQDGLPSA